MLALIGDTPLERVFKPGDPPQPPLLRGENSVKVPLFKGDLGGSKSDGEGEKTRPRGIEVSEFEYVSPVPVSQGKTRFL